VDGLAELSDPTHELRTALAGLVVEDVLALCYRFRTDRGRLRLYLDALRQRPGERAALAAALICFDLAQQGHTTAQLEFEALAVTLRQIDRTEQAAAELIAGSPYLTEMWPRCRFALRSIDPRLAGDEALASAAEAIEINLFDEAELDDFDSLIVEEIDPYAMAARYQRTVDEFFATYVEPLPPLGSRGLFARTRADLDRLETFVRELDSMREYVPAANAMLALVKLFIGTHLRAKTFWGKPNLRKQELLASGLRHFATCGEHVFQTAAYFTGRDADTLAWAKVAQLLLDYLRWLKYQWRGLLDAAPYAYAALGRELPPIDGSDRRERREILAGD
jgi:hypothetical protein